MPKIVTVGNKIVTIGTSAVSVPDSTIFDTELVQTTSAATTLWASNGVSYFIVPKTNNVQVYALWGMGAHEACIASNIAYAPVFVTGGCVEAHYYNDAQTGAHIGTIINIYGGAISGNTLTNSDPHIGDQETMGDWIQTDPEIDIEINGPADIYKVLF